MSYTDRDSTPKSYRYYYMHGGLLTQADGEKRGFDEEWQALQYMDENREHAQAAANESGDVGVIQVQDMDSFGKERIVSVEFLMPARPKFVREGRGIAETNRPTLGDLMIEAATAFKKGGVK